MSKDLLTLAELSAAEIRDVLDRAAKLKARRANPDAARPLAGRSVAMIFEKPSLRTRATFEIGVFELGGYALFLDSELGKRETVPDMARNLERWVGGIVARVHSHAKLEELARHASVPVVNALSDDFHPCQILADAQTLIEHRSSLDGLQIAFVGDGNNVFASWAMLATRFDFELTLVCPKGYEPNERVMKALDAAGGQKFRIVHDLADGVANADAVYTDVWTSMGQENEEADRLDAFRPYQVNAGAMAAAKPDALFMHCLPAHRGEEVTDEVIDGPRSVVFDQAENRLHAQKAVLAKLITEHGS